MLGFCEGSSFVGIMYVLGSWYKRTELGKRTAIFACSAYVGTMFGGYIQSAVKSSLDGRNGIEAWRWVFIIDGKLQCLKRVADLRSDYCYCRNIWLFLLS